jgi:hypothetical protein
MAAFRDALLTLENLGLLDVLLPFLLVFTIAFAVLQKSKILGPDSKRFNVIISFVLAMTVVIPHVLGVQPSVVDIINKALPNVSLLMVAFMMALLLIGVFGQDVNIGGTQLEGWVVMFSFVAVAYIFLVSGGLLDRPPPWLSWLTDPETKSVLIAVLVFGIIVWFITKEEKELDKRQSVGDTMKDIFGGTLGGKK